MRIERFYWVAFPHQTVGVRIQPAFPEMIMSGEEEFESLNFEIVGICLLLQWRDRIWMKTSASNAAHTIACNFQGIYLKRCDNGVGNSRRFWRLLTDCM